jgi:xanthine dehydrogenase YagS FAD-binding subunit
MAASGMVVRAVISGGSFRLIRIAAGGIAPVPLRLLAAEAAVQDATATMASVAEAAQRSIKDATPLRQTRYKVDLLRSLVLDLLGSLVA